MKIALISKTPEGTILIKIVTPGSNFQQWIEVDRIEVAGELKKETPPIESGAERKS